MSWGAIFQGCRRYSYLCLSGIVGRRAAGTPGNWGSCRRDRAHWSGKRNLLWSQPQLPCLGENPGATPAQSSAEVNAASTERGRRGVSPASACRLSQSAHHVPRCAASRRGRGRHFSQVAWSEIKPSDLC